MSTPSDNPGTISWENGYSETCLKAAEERWGFVFPPDLVRLLRAYKPVGPRIWDWDTATDDDMAARQRFIREGIAFDVVYNGFWMERWGERPDLSDAPQKWSHDASDAFVDHINRAFITPIIDQAPPLIPIYAHRFMPSDPSVEGLPVLSINQTDIIYYGLNLRDYFHHEFGVDIGSSFGTIRGRSSPESDASEPLRPTFWSEFMDAAWRQK